MWGSESRGKRSVREKTLVGWPLPCLSCFPCLPCLPSLPYLPCLPTQPPLSTFPTLPTLPTLLAYPASLTYISYLASHVLLTLLPCLSCKDCLPPALPTWSRLFVVMRSRNSMKGSLLSWTASLNVSSLTPSYHPQSLSRVFLTCFDAKHFNDWPFPLWQSVSVRLASWATSAFLFFLLFFFPSQPVSS